MHNARAIRRPDARPLGKFEGEKSSGGKGRWIAAIVILLLLFLAVGAWAYYGRKDPHMARIEQLRAELDNAKGDQRRELFGKMREEFRSLSPEAREKMFEGRRREWEAREQKYLNDFFAMTQAQQVAEIDKQLKEDEKRRKEREERRAKGDRRGRGQGNARGGQGRGGQGGRDSTERRKGYLDSTNPTTRAQRGELQRMRDERREALGLPGGGGGRRR